MEKVTGTFTQIIQVQLCAPTVRSFTDYAYIFGWRHKCLIYDHFVLNNYGNLFFIDYCEANSRSTYRLDLFPGPSLRKLAQLGVLSARGHDLWRDLYGNELNIFDFLREKLALNECCQIVLDCFYLRGTAPYKTTHHVHQYLVTALDVSRKRVGLTGYFDLREDDYGLQWISYNEFIQALDWKHDVGAHYGQRVHATWSYRYAESFKINVEFRHKFDSQRTLQQFKDYLNGTFSINQVGAHNRSIEGMTVSFGIKVYDRLQEWLEILARGASIDFRICRLVWEHKVLVVEKVEFLTKQCGYVIHRMVLTQLQEVARLASEFRLLIFSFDRIRSPDILRKASRCLNKCRELEILAYGRICS
ncbi:MAG TPA: hypothetical protein VG734_15125 [Lacunisphaera sp.]|nr:hypothetical protein [Lacunisphaera sp.]